MDDETFVLDVNHPSPQDPVAQRNYDLLYEFPQQISTAVAYEDKFRLYATHSPSLLGHMRRIHYYCSRKSTDAQIQTQTHTRSQLSLRLEYTT